MKKTLLLSLLGISTFAVAGGKVKFINELSNTPFVFGEEANFKNGFKTNHKLVANIKEKNFILETELKTEGKLDNDKYKAGEKVEGSLKVGYDNGTLAGSLKYDFAKAETFIDGSYKYVDGILTLKPNAQLKLEVLSPAKLTLGNDTTYKFDDMVTLKNESKIFTSVYGMKGENDTVVSSFGLSSKTSVEYKVTDEVKLKGNASSKFEKEKVLEYKVGNKKADDNSYDNKKLYELATDAKVEFESKLVKGLKSDAEVKYAYTVNSANAVEDNIKYSTKSNKHSFSLDSNVSYDVDLTNGFELTPAFNLNYKGEVEKLSDSLVGVDGIAKLTKHIITVKPNAKLSYKYDKLTAGLKLESPVEFSGVNYKQLSKNQIIRLTDKDFDVKKFGYENAGFKTTLSLEYKW